VQEIEKNIAELDVTIGNVIYKRLQEEKKYY
jgi:hypothetical protein